MHPVINNKNKFYSKNNYTSKTPGKINNSSKMQSNN